ncbi:hypothetical protein SDC9_12893 [bioreactor metagenome]|uniref:Uncharacterized protein n=1 Tax=bioreactor metagenome TaxID=1076179 RepID=A0A644TLJ0_9ZZZZ
MGPGADLPGARGRSDGQPQHPRAKPAPPTPVRRRQRPRPHHDKRRKRRAGTRTHRAAEDMLCPRRPMLPAPFRGRAGCQTPRDTADPAAPPEKAPPSVPGDQDLVDHLNLSVRPPQIRRQDGDDGAALIAQLDHRTIGLDPQIAAAEGLDHVRARLHREQPPQRRRVDPAEEDVAIEKPGQLCPFCRVRVLIQHARMQGAERRIDRREDREHAVPREGLVQPGRLQHRRQGRMLGRVRDHLHDAPPGVGRRAARNRSVSGKRPARRAKDKTASQERLENEMHVRWSSCSGLPRRQA